MTEAIRAQVEALLKEKGLSKAALGRELGMHREQVARLFALEGNQIPPTWEKIFEYLNLELTIRPSSTQKGDKMFSTVIRKLEKALAQAHSAKQIMNSVDADQALVAEYIMEYFKGVKDAYKQLRSEYPSPQFINWGNFEQIPNKFHLYLETASNVQSAVDVLGDGEKGELKLEDAVDMAAKRLASVLRTAGKVLKDDSVQP